MSLQSRTSVIVTPNKGIQMIHNFNPVINKYENIPLPLIDDKGVDSQDYRIDYPHGRISLFKLVPPFSSQTEKHKSRTNSEPSSKLSSHSSSAAAPASSYAKSDVFLPSIKLPPRGSVSKRIRTTQNAPLSPFQRRYHTPNRTQNSKKFINISGRVGFSQENMTDDNDIITINPQYELWNYEDKRYEKNQTTFTSPKIIGDLLQEEEIQSTFFVRDSPDGGIRHMTFGHWFLMPVQGWFALSIILFALLFFAVIICFLLYRSLRKKQKLVLKLLNPQDYIIKTEDVNSIQNNVPLSFAVPHTMTSLHLPRPTVSRSASYITRPPHVHQPPSSEQDEDSSVYEENEDFH